MNSAPSPRSTPDNHSKRTLAPMSAVTAPMTRLVRGASNRRPSTPRPAQITATAVLGWIEIPAPPQSVSRGRSNAHPASETIPPARAYPARTIAPLRRWLVNPSASADQIVSPRHARQSDDDLPMAVTEIPPEAHVEMRRRRVLAVGRRQGVGIPVKRELHADS